MRAAQSPPRVSTLILQAALSVLALNMFLPSLANMAADFGADYALVNLSVAGFLAVSAVLQIIIGPLSDRYGRRPVLMWSTAAFTLASIGCILAQSVGVFLFFRMLQSAIAAGVVAGRAVVRDMHPPNQAASLLGYIGMAMALAPIVGPMAGGFLDVAFGWRSVFVFYALAGGAMMVLLWSDLGETNTAPSATFRQQLREYPQLLGSRRFWGYSLCMAFSVGGFYAFITGAPLVAAAWFGLSPAVLGLGIGIITFGFMMGNFVTGRIARRTRLITMVIAGRLFGVAGPMAGLILFATGAGNPWVFFGAAIAVGFGNGLTTPNASAGVMSVRPQLAGSASGLSGALIVALGAVLTTLTGVIVSPDNAPYAVLGIMLGSGILGLVAALYVLRIDRREETGV